MTTSADPRFVQDLASVLLTGTWGHSAVRERLHYRFSDDRTLAASLVDKVWTHFTDGRPTAKMLIAYLKVAIANEPTVLEIRNIELRRRRMKSRWPVRSLSSARQLADWLQVSLGQLDWLADIKGLTLKQDAAKLRHYVNVWVPKRRGKPRLLEAPKPRLKAIQKRILHEILDQLPPHEAVHGFRRGRSILTYVQPHVGQRIVLRFDLRDFFPSVTAARVRAIFRSAGYPHEVAALLAALCTTRTPAEVDVPLRWRLRHLPQGTPTSPALANLAAYRLDVRLHALAQKLGANYTRYADDLAFSGDRRLERAAKHVQILVGVIAAEEGFELHFRKSRFMRQSVRQQLAGVIVNERPNLGRDWYDELKAILHNCLRHGPAAQNRAGHADFRRHLLGRIAYARMLNPERGAKLLTKFGQIVWEDRIRSQ